MQSREVIVVGAGIAGLTAARELSIDGYDVAILEARERTPARYRSVALYDEDGRRLSADETAEMSELMADYLDFIAAKQ